MNDLEWLADWYMSNCNGEWEEYYGIKIQTIDNPGWLVEIDILETVLENLSFATINIDNSDEDWMNCKVENGKYIGVGDQTKLAEIIKIFLEGNSALAAHYLGQSLMIGVAGPVGGAALGALSRMGRAAKVILGRCEGWRFGEGRTADRSSRRNRNQYSTTSAL